MEPTDISERIPASNDQRARSQWIELTGVLTPHDSAPQGPIGSGRHTDEQTIKRALLARSC